MIAELKAQFEYAVARSGFYKEKFSGETCRSLEAFQALPFTTKQEVLGDQEEHPPFGANLCIDKRDVVRVHKTSGTTNKPVMIALTREDIQHTVDVGSACFRLSGLGPGGLVVHCLNYNMWAGGYTDHQSLEATGAGVIPFGVGNSRTLIETILRVKPTAIHCTPSYLSKLEYVLQQDFHIGPADLKLRLGLFGGESGLQNPGFRRNIETRWGLKAMNANYGMSEVLSMFGAESSKQEGLHFMAEGVLYPELVDVQTRQPLPIEAGVVGELVTSNLCKQAQPLLRYRSGDVFKVISTGDRKGRPGFRFEIVGRTDDMLVVKGLNVFVSSVDRLVAKHLEELTGIFNILVNRDDPIDTFILKAEAREPVDEAGRVSLQKRLENEFDARIGFRAKVELVDVGALERVEGKAKKLHRVL